MKELSELIVVQYKSRVLQALIVDGKKRILNLLVLANGTEKLNLTDMSTKKEYSISGEGRVLHRLCIVVDDVKQHTKFQGGPSTSHGCETAGSKQCLVAGVPGLVTNSPVE